MRLLLVPALLVPFVACDEVSGLDTGDPFAAAPDIAGTYDVVLSDAQGCDGTPAAPDAWLPGTLVVSGEPASLTFDLGDGARVPGTVDASFFWELGGDVTVDGVAVSVFADGVAGEEAGAHVLDGSVSIEAATTPPCTATAQLTASQVTS